MSMNIPNVAEGDQQLNDFIAKYSPEIGELAQVILTKMRTRLTGAIEIVYDNYNALAIGFGPTERASEIIFSIALYPRWISLFFMQAAGIPDPENLLKGSGKKVRHIVLKDASDLDSPAIDELISQALKCAAKPLDKNNARQIVIKSVSPKQRPRRPAK